jgi:SAM-dependent methyltransferase
MDRIHELLRHVAPGARGIEVGAYHHPLTPKSAGYRSIQLDVFDDAELQKRAVADPLITDEATERLEPVDLVGSAVDIAELVEKKFGDEKFDYVLSSHNLEHLPDPIKFLQGADHVLREDGYLSLALPDHRYCFDFYRTRTELHEWLEAFAEQRTSPTAAQVFHWSSAVSALDGKASWSAASRNFPEPIGDLAGMYDVWKQMRAGTIDYYVDAHCWMFTPASFRLLLEDLRFLGLHSFAIDSITPTRGAEFFAHLRRTSAAAAESLSDPTAYAAHRAEVLREVMHESWQARDQFSKGRRRKRSARRRG